MASPRLLIVLSAIALLLLAPAIKAEQDQGKAYGDPEKFEKAIAAYEAADEQAMPETGGVVCVGSSSMRMWADRIEKDLDPLTVIPRGFGGSNMNDLLFYADRIVLKYKPRAVVIYEGDNDIAQGVSPKKIAQTFDALVEKIHEELPDCRVYILAIKPSPKRWDMWPGMVETNGLFKKACAKSDLLTFIDIATPMLGEDGKPRPELYLKDQLHMTPAGYDAWREAVRPVLVKEERRYE